MSSATFLLVSLALGGALAALMLWINRHRWPAGWRRILLVTTAVLLGFNFTSAFGDLVLGEAAMPPWSRVARSLWLVALGLIYAFQLQPMSQSGTAAMRPVGYFMIAGGLAAALAYTF